jgi:hypothetical protein
MALWHRASSFRHFWNFWVIRSVPSVRRAEQCLKFSSFKSIQFFFLPIAQMIESNRWIRRDNLMCVKNLPPLDAIQWNAPWRFYSLKLCFRINFPFHIKNLFDLWRFFQCYSGRSKLFLKNRETRVYEIADKWKNGTRVIGHRDFRVSLTHKSRDLIRKPKIGSLERKSHQNKA